MSNKDDLVVVTSVGTLVYPHLNQVDTKFSNGDETKAKYHTKVSFPLDDPKTREIKAKVDEYAAKYKTNKVPYSVDESDGTITFSAKSGYKYRPQAQDTQGNAIDLDETNIWGGTKAKLKIRFRYYKGFGGGIGAYLDAYRVFELVSSGGGDDFGDPEEDGYTVGDAPAATGGEESFGF